jgi:iron complex transport system substrate-binding protein
MFEASAKTTSLRLRFTCLVIGLICTVAPIARSSFAGAERLVSTAPSITETLYALGAGDSIVGLTSYCRYPEQALSKPIIGDFAAPSVEAILEQRPDLVILLAGREDLVQKLQPFGLKILVLEHETLPQLFESFLILGKHIGRGDEARELVHRIKTELSRIQASLRAIPRRRVLFLVGRNPGALSDIYAVGSSGYLGQLLELAGGENVFRDLPGVYPKVSIEEIIKRDPEIIIDMSTGMSYSDREDFVEEKIRDIRELWSHFPTIAAVRESRVEVVMRKIFLVPGPRVAEAVRILADLFHKGMLP